MPSNLFVVLMGMGTVFLGLICLIALTYVMSAILKAIKGNTPAASPAAQPAAPAAAPVAAPAAASPAPVETIPDRQALVAAISAAIAEDLGTSISSIRIHSLRRVSPVAQDRQALVAAISAAIAEDLGTSVNNIRIHSMKQL